MIHEAFVVKYDDWKGLYVDGSLVREAHSFSDQDIAEALAGEAFTLECRWVEQVPEAGRFPASRTELDEMYDWETGNLRPGFPAMEE